MILIKKYNFILLLFLLFLFIILKQFSPSNNISIEKIYGLWVDDNNDYLLQIEFREKNQCEIFFVDKNKEINLRLNGIFDLDTKKKPTLLSIKKIKSLDYPLYSIINIDKNGYLKIAKFSNKWRMRSIDFKYDSFTLKKATIIN